MNRVRQPHTLLVLGLNAEMGTTAGADELVEIPAQKLLTFPNAGGHQGQAGAHRRRAAPTGQDPLLYYSHA